MPNYSELAALSGLSCLLERAYRWKRIEPSRDALLSNTRKENH